MPIKSPFEIIANAITLTDSGMFCTQTDAFDCEDAPTPETKSVLKRNGNHMEVAMYKDGKFSGSVSFMASIDDVRVFNDGNGNPAAIRVDFSDGTYTTAVRQGDDVFSFEQGVAVCITKKILGTVINSDGGSLYNKLIHYGCKVYEENRKAERRWKECEDQDRARKKKLAEKKRRRDERKAEKVRDEQINVQKEAILRAIKEYNLTLDDLK